MRITPGPLVLLLLAACQSEPPPIQNPDTDTDTDTDIGDTDTGEPLPPWLAKDQVGQLFVIDEAGNASVPAALKVYGMFGDHLQDVATAPWCLGAGFCYDALPADDDGLVQASSKKLDPFASVWSWNGHSIDVADRKIPFSYDPIVGFGWYAYEGDPLGPEADTEITVAFDGEWGPFEGSVVIEPLELTEPVAGIALPATAPTTLRWKPTGGDSVYLRLKTPDGDRLWRLKDDGVHDFDPRDYGLDELRPDQYSFALQRWKSQEIDVNGNDLTLHGVWQQHFDFLTCKFGDYPDGKLASGTPPLVPIMPAARMKVGFQAVIDQGRIYDYNLDHDLDGATSLFSATIHFVILDNVGQELCTVVYDASNALHLGAPNPASGNGKIFEAWQINGLNNGQHDCTIIDDAVYGAKDIRQLITASTWGIGIGTVDVTQNALKGEFDWNVWQPLLNGAYVARDGVWQEVGGVASSGMESCGTVHPGLQALPAVKQGPLPARLYSSTPVVDFPL